MAGDTSVSSSSVFRSRIAVVLVTSIIAGFGIYYYHDSHQHSQPIDSTESSALHRSNAIHRRRRRTTVNNENISPILPTGNVEHDEDATTVARNLGDGDVGDADTAMNDPAYVSDFGLQDPSSSDRTGQNTVQLLFRVSEDAATRNAYIHRGCLCNSCGVVPIRGIRYRCANCADFDLCEGCEAQGLHTRTHVFFKIRVPIIPIGAGQMQPVWYTGDPDTKMRVLPKELVTRLSRETGMNRPELDACWEQWTFMASTDWREDPDEINLAMDRKTFERCLLPFCGQKHAPPSLIFERMFAFYDINKDDLIGFPEFINGLAFRKKKNKWQKIFDGYDIDEDGYAERRDFLRMFRSYYVIHKQMQQDMILSLEEQLSSTDAHSLVNGRQPLSSAFGQDGRYPRPAEPRTGEGKVRRPNGELEVTDGRGIVNESSNDTGNREDIFRRHLSRRSSWLHGRPGLSARTRSRFWDTLLHPPMSLDQVPDILDGLNRARREVLQNMPDDGRVFDEDLADTDNGEDPEENVDSDEPLLSQLGAMWPPDDVIINEEDVQAVLGAGISVADVPPEHRQAVTTYAIDRAHAHDLLHDRWKRRQFYTDEEEGASPPSDWDEEEDILLQNGVGPENSKNYSRSSLHSRSSSKVRFAEDMDDFDTRSNPSTSSRSVPERWGGMEIPDAEKDAGKEILYQVTQQAFNDLLDPLFRAKEDLALEAAANVVERDKYRSLFDRPGFLKWATEKEIEDKTNVKVVVSRSPKFQVENMPEPRDAEVEEMRRRSLGDLLASTGYTVEEPDSDDDNSITEEVPQSAPSPPEPAAYLEEDNDVATSAVVALAEYGNAINEVESMLEQHSEMRDGALQSSISRPSPSHSRPRSSTASSYRDPTLPQFRPNTSSPSSSRSPLPAPSRSSESLKSNVQQRKRAHKLSKSSDQTRHRPSSPIDKDKSNESLYRLWICDKAAQEAEKRGGWGRLNFEEFESVIKRHAIDAKPGNNEMDYLGSWIEFCIP